MKFFKSQQKSLNYFYKHKKRTNLKKNLKVLKNYTLYTQRLNFKKFLKIFLLPLAITLNLLYTVFQKCKRGNRQHVLLTSRSTTRP